ncbi:MAG: FHA domain-containing protein [Bdellovibrionaceae bacterium]|nr:FHA domain-containing protein [Pseudobdellovibrionaceae bacterium]
MWVLEISKNGRELTRAAVDKASVLVGRSPACDIVLRYPGIRPVHFLIEWIGEGEPQPGEMDWSILDIYAGIAADAASVDATAASDTGSGMGQLIGREKVAVSDFEFRWFFDPLAETQVKKGLLSSRLRQHRDEDDTSYTFHSESQILEIVTVDSQRERVVDISHTQLGTFKIGYHALPDLPQVMMHTPHESRAQFSLERVPEARAYLRGFPIRQDDLKETVLGPNDLLQVRWNLHDYYLRLVPEVKSPPAPRINWKDPFLLWNVGALAVLMLVIFIVARLPLEEAIKDPTPPRIAQVVVSSLPPPAPPSEKEQELFEPAQPREEAVPMSNVPVQEVIQQKAEAVAPEKAPPKENRPSAPAEKKDVTKMGLLANLRAKKDAQVKADRVLNQGIVSDTASGKGGFVVKQAPAGEIADRDKGRSLDEASTSVKASDQGAVNNLGSLQGSESGSLASVRYTNNDARGNTGRESVTGGLDRASVLRTIRTYNKEIRNCYEKALLVKPKIKGRMVLSWTITANGATSNAKLERSELKLPSLEGCVLDVVRGIQWPKSANGQSTIVNYPWQFTSSR